MIHVPLLLALGCPAKNADAFAEALESSRDVGQITTPLRCAHYLSQTAEETQGFARLEENLHYTNAKRLDGLFSNVRGIDHANALIKAGPEAIANCAYANHGGNGDEASGDGFRYRGRGFLQITLKANYQAFEKATGIPVVSQPDLLLHPHNAAIAAAHYWTAKDINSAADCDSYKAVTALINPGLAGLTERGEWLKKTKKALGVLA